MKKGDVFIILFLIILITSFIFIYQNSESLDCSMESSFGDVMSDLTYEFEPEGSTYGKTRIYRFIISSFRGRLEYFGMEIKDEKENTLFFENLTNPEGGSISISIEAEENEVLTIKRFFKKECFAEVLL